MSKKVPNREKNFNSLSGNKLKEYYSSDKKSDKYFYDFNKIVRDVFK